MNKTVWLASTCDGLILTKSSMKYIFNFFVNKYPLAAVGVIKYPVCLLPFGLPLPLSVLLMPISGSCWGVSLQYWRNTWPARISAIYLPPIHSWRTKSLKYIKWRLLLGNVLKTAWHSYSIPCDHVVEWCFCQFDPTVLLNSYTSVAFCVICVCVSVCVLQMGLCLWEGLPGERHSYWILGHDQGKRFWNLQWQGHGCCRLRHSYTGMDEWMLDGQIDDWQGDAVMVMCYIIVFRRELQSFALSPRWSRQRTKSKDTVLRSATVTITATVLPLLVPHINASTTITTTVY